MYDQASIGVPNTRESAKMGVEHKIGTSLLDSEQ